MRLDSAALSLGIPAAELRYAAFAPCAVSPRVNTAAKTNSSLVGVMSHPLNGLLHIIKQTARTGIINSTMNKKGGGAMPKTHPQEQRAGEPKNSLLGCQAERSTAPGALHQSAVNLPTAMHETEDPVVILNPVVAFVARMPRCTV